MAPSTLSALLGQTQKVDSPNFWVSLAKLIDTDSAWSGKLSVKGKQNLIVAFRYAWTTADKNHYTEIIIQFIDNLKKDQNSAKTSQSLMVTFIQRSASS